MTANFEPVPGVIRVRLTDPFDKFWVLIVPAPQYGENYRTFYLMCDGFGVVVDMFSCEVRDDQHAANMAANNGPSYINAEDYF